MGESSKYLSREELHAMVWSKPTQTIALDLGKSDVAIGKLCKKLNVPKPPRGWWARKLAGANVRILPLRKPKKDQVLGVWVSPKPKKDTDTSEINEKTLEQIASLKTSSAKVIVPETLINPHKLIRQSRQMLRSAKGDIYGRLHAGWDKESLDICVSRSSLARALIFFDAFIKEMKKLSYDVRIRTKHSIATVVVAGEAEIEISLFERANRFEQILTDKQRKEEWRYDKYRYEPSGELELIAHRGSLGQRTWKDTPLQGIESRLNDIAAEIVLSFELMEIESKKRELQYQQALKTQLVLAEEKRRKEHEERQRAILERQISEWTRANKIRTFADACENVLRDEGKLSTASIEANWLAWAREYADELDPCKSGAFVELIEGFCISE